MIRKISLRLRVTLITAFILSAFCMVLTFSSVYNANRYIVGPVLDTYRDMTIPGVQDFGVDSPNYAYNSGMEQTMPDVTLKNGADGFTAASYFSMAIAVLAGSLLVYFLSGYALRPIKELSMRIEKITEKELSTQLPKLETNDELQTLSESFNLMLKRLEAAFQREKRFTSDAAHELKTPLTVINTNLDVFYMNADPTKEQYQNTLAVIKKQANRMTALVEDLFSMSSMNRYKVEDVIEISGLVRETAQELDIFLDEKSLTLTVDTQECLVLANAVILKQAISNLIENAIKYNKNGGFIKVQVKNRSDQCQIIVRDSGIGIPPEKAVHIFEPFYRVDTSRSREIGGAGLGLAITKDIVQQHGGTICYQACDTGGSCFMITLPKAE